MTPIKKLRTETGLSQNKFATTLDIPIANIQHWEQGVSAPPEYVLKLIERDLTNKGLITR